MRALALVLGLGLTGCMIEAPIVIEPPAPDGGPIVIVPPVFDGGPIIIVPGDGGPGGPPPPPENPMPGSGQGTDTGTGVLWLVRVDPGTANLAESYASVVAKMNQGLAAAGFSVRTTAVGSLYESRLLWSTQGAGTDGLAAALTAEAQRSGATPTACSTQALANLGERLSSVSAGSSIPFSARRGVLLVGVLDHAQRPVAYASASCSYLGATPDVHFGTTAARAQWLNRTGGWTLPLLQTRFAFVATSEFETAGQQRARCDALAAFPNTALDVIAPSTNAVYPPWAMGLAQRQAGLARSFDLCEAVGGDFATQAGGFARDWAQALRSSTGQP